MTNMLPITPFIADADFAPEDAREADIREVQVVGIAEGMYGYGFVVIENVGGWEYARHVDAVKWKPKRETVEDE